MYTTNKTTKSIADAALKVMMGEAKSPAQQAAIAIAMKEKGQKPKEEMKEALHPNQQKLDVHEPEKDKLTAKDFEMLRKGKKAPTAIKEEDAYDKDRYAVKNGKAVKDNPTHMGSPNYKDQPHHVWASSAEEAMKKKKVNEGTVVGEILKRIDEMKGGKYAWPGTPEYKKQFPDREMKAGEEKATKTGVVKKTIKGLVHTAKPMKEEVEVKKEDEIKVLAKEEVSFQNLINLYMDNGVESLLKTVEKIKEEASNDEYHKEVEENKKKAEGKVKQPEVAKGAVKAVAITKEEVEQIDEGLQQTLRKYVPGYAKNQLNKKMDAQAYAPGDSTKKTVDKDVNYGRYKKIYDKLKKEEVEQVEEAAKWRSTSVAKKVTDPDDESSVSYDYHYDNPKSTGMKKATSDTPEKYSSLSARPHAQVASRGARKGMITKQHAERLKARIKAGMNNEEVEQFDETNNPFDLKNYKSQLKTKPGEKAGFDSKKTSTGTVYSRKPVKDEPMKKEEVEQFDERTLTKGETKEKERIVKGMKKNLAGFKARYGERAKSVMYATATKQAMKD